MWDILLEIYEKGGIMMVPLAGCSIVTVMLIIERGLVLRQSYLFPRFELEKLRSSLAGIDISTIHELRPSTDYPAGRILAYGLSIMPANAVHFKEALQDQARRERHYMERGLVILEVIVGIAPLLGLLGTALGMIQVFDHIAMEGPERTQALSHGISEALLTTVVGLTIGIPALIAYNLFNRKVESLGLFIEEEAMFFYYKLFGDT